MTRKTFSLGDICESRIWFELEIQPVDVYSFSIMPTYNGTITGLVWLFGFGTLIAHIRDIHFFD